MLLPIIKRKVQEVSPLTLVQEAVKKAVCFFRGHLWIEWEHGGSRPRREFIKGKAILKNPECFRCGERKHATHRPLPLIQLAVEQ